MRRRPLRRRPRGDYARTSGRLPCERLVLALLVLVVLGGAPGSGLAEEGVSLVLPFAPGEVPARTVRARELDRRSSPPRGSPPDARLRKVRERGGGAGRTMPPLPLRAKLPWHELIDAYVTTVPISATFPGREQEAVEYFVERVTPPPLREMVRRFFMGEGAGWVQAHGSAFGSFHSLERMELAGAAAYLATFVDPHGPVHVARFDDAGDEIVARWTVSTARVLPRGTALMDVQLGEDGQLFWSAGGKLYGVDPERGEVVWESRAKVAAHEFAIVGDLIVCAYGGSGADDFAYLVDGATGSVIDELPLRTGAVEVRVDGDSVLLVTYDRDVWVEIERSSGTAGAP